MNQIRGRITEINKKADVLLDGLSPQIQGFVNNKLRDLASEKRRLQRRLEELQAVPYEKETTRRAGRRGSGFSGATLAVPPGDGQTGAGFLNTPRCRGVSDPSCTSVSVP